MVLLARRMYCLHASGPDSRRPPVSFWPPKAPPILAPEALLQVTDHVFLDVVSQRPRNRETPSGEQHFQFPLVLFQEKACLSFTRPARKCPGTRAEPKGGTMDVAVSAFASPSASAVRVRSFRTSLAHLYECPLAMYWLANYRHQSFRCLHGASRLVRACRRPLWSLFEAHSCHWLSNSGASASFILRRTVFPDVRDWLQSR